MLFSIFENWANEFTLIERENINKTKKKSRNSTSTSPTPSPNVCHLSSLDLNFEVQQFFGYDISKAIKMHK
jgi:hypothetical protein